MATLGRRIEPKPSTTNISEAIPFLLVPVARQPAVAIPTQFIPRTVFVDAQSLQTNMDSNREGKSQRYSWIWNFKEFQTKSDSYPNYCQENNNKK